MTTKLKIAVGEGWGILSFGRVQLEFNLGRAGGKKSPVYKKHLVQVAALGNNFIPFVKCGPPAVRWHKAEDGPVLIVCMWSAHPSAPRCDLRGSSCGHSCGG